MPAKVYLICGKICIGKSFYVNKIKSETGAVVLSCDELTSDLFDNNMTEILDIIENPGGESNE